MKIAITADPEIPVPPNLYGGIERIIDLLIRGLEVRGHRVTLFAHSDSSTPCELVPYAGKSSRSGTDIVKNMLTVTRSIIGGDGDLVHSFGRVAYLLPLLPLSIPKLMTYQRAISPTTVKWGHRLSRGSLHFSAISNWMTDGIEHLANFHLVPNGVPMDVYDFSASVAEDAPLLFLGRIEHIKGAHLAIDIAKRSGRRLVIAGNVPEEHQDYFDHQIKPHLDGVNITYVGPVNDEQKNHLLGATAAFLMPILWEEPFGIVMAEALACGTPVLGLCRGAVPEVVEDGVTGFVRGDIDELVATVSRIHEIDRAACRQRAQNFYSETAVVAGYLDVYRKLGAY